MMKQWKRMTSSILVLLMLISLLPVAAFAAEGVAISEENFPDANFRGYISMNFDADKNGTLSQTELDAAKQMHVRDQGIESLVGIGFFANLEILNCEYCNMKALDVSKNTKLISLECSGNPLTALDVSKNTLLEILTC